MDIIICIYQLNKDIAWQYKIYNLFFQIRKCLRLLHKVHISYPGLENRVDSLCGDDQVIEYLQCVYGHDILTFSIHAYLLRVT